MAAAAWMDMLKAVRPVDNRSVVRQGSLNAPMHVSDYGQSVFEAGQQPF